MSIKLVIGLGNVGSEYARTRHNAGEIALRCLAREFGVDFVYDKYCRAQIAKARVGGSVIVLAFVDGYMNNSGVGLKGVLKHLKLNIADVVVMYDDITLEVGRMKLSKGGSSGGHNGITDIMNRCGNDFVRIRIGIGGKIDKRMELSEHVLGKLSEADLQSIQALKIGECVRLMLTKDFEAAQNVVNRKDAPPQKSAKAVKTADGVSDAGEPSKSNAEFLGPETAGTETKPAKAEPDGSFSKTLTEAFKKLLGKS